jgi:hypothetical protein
MVALRKKDLGKEYVCNEVKCETAKYSIECGSSTSAHLPTVIADKLLHFSVAETSTEKVLTEQDLSDVYCM